MDTVVVGVGVLLLLAAMILAIRPTGDEAADGSIRTTPTTASPTTVSPTTTEAPAFGDAQSDIVADIDEGEDVHRRVQGVNGTEFSSVVRADVGYFAATWELSDSSILYRSVDGVDWTNVEAQFPDQIERAIAAQSLSFSHLRRTADGFAMLVHVHSGDGADDLSFTISRLVSTNGIEWEIQTEIALASSSELFSAYPLLHTDSVWGYASNGDRTRLLRQLLEVNLVDVETISAATPCFLDAQSDKVANIYECDGLELIPLTTDDVIDGVSLRQLARCADTFFGVGTYDVSIVDIETGKELRKITVPENAQVAEELSASGTLAGVTFDGFVDDPSVCDGLIDLPVHEYGPVMIWDSDSADARNIALPDDHAVGQFDGWRQSVVRDDHLVVLEAGQAWTLDLLSFEWSEATSLLGDRPVPSFSFSHVNDAGDAVVSTAGSSDVYVTDLDTSMTRVIETGLPFGFDWITYADDDIALIGASSSIYRIDLRADSPPGPDEG